MSGWIKLHRSLLDWEWYNDCNVVYTFVHLLLEANWEDKKWRGMIIPRGSLVTSVAKLAESLKLTIQQTRTVLNKLKSTNNITIKTTNGYSLITIVNYDLHQNCGDEITNEITSKKTNEQQTNNKPSNKRITTTKESKNQEYNIYNNTPLTPQEVGEKKVPVKVYAFEGKFVKLNEKDFNHWKKAFPNVELEGFLTSYDAWLKNQPEKVQKEWYMRCSGYLAKKNQENAKNKPAAVTAGQSPKSEETIWELYERMGIPHKKPEVK